MKEKKKETYETQRSGLATLFKVILLAEGRGSGVSVFTFEVVPRLFIQGSFELFSNIFSFFFMLRATSERAKIRKSKPNQRLVT